MKGTISVESEPGKGSRFICRIPFEISDGAEAAPDEKVQAQQGCGTDMPFNLHILVAEDNKINQEVIKAHLKRMGCSCKFADNGSIALRMLEEYHFDLVLMDVQMPVMDGLEATLRIRKNEEKKGSHIPIIALTAGAMAEDIEKCLKAGMDAHIPKSIRSGNLSRMIGRYVKTGLLPQRGCQSEGRTTRMPF